MKKIMIVVMVLLLVGLSVIFYLGLSKEEVSDITNETESNEEINDNNSNENENDVKKPEEPEEKTQTASIIASGDIMFHDTQLISGYNEETKKFDFNDVFKYVKKYISEADVAIGNYETVTGGEELGFRGYPTFNSPVETIEALKNAGFDILTTANNHILDTKKEGVFKTIENINKYGLESVGTYKDDKKEILIEDINGIKIAFLSYTYGVNGYADIKNNAELSNIINIIDEDKIKKDTEKCKENGADVVVVSLHWGSEYQRTPSQSQKVLANKMFDWGVDIILGSHPHVIQKSEIIKHNGKDKFIIYSMGNFISNQRRETLKTENKNFTEDGILVKIDLERTSSESEVIIKNVEYIPTWVNREKVSEKYKYEIIPVKDFMNSVNDLLNNETLEKVKESYNNTIDIMDLTLQK